MDHQLPPTVWVRRHWCDQLHAEYRLVDLTGLHWSDNSDGYARRSPNPMVHGYVMCHQMISGDALHPCLDGQWPPHRIKVCVVAKDNPKALMVRLKARATENDRRRSLRAITPRDRIARKRAG
jgi:hypothetical protein